MHGTLACVRSGSLNAWSALLMLALVAPQGFRNRSTFLETPHQRGRVLRGFQHANTDMGTSPSDGVSADDVLAVVADNPLGQSDEQTPFGLVRRMGSTAPAPEPVLARA